MGYATLSLRYHQGVWAEGPELANLISESWGGGAKEAIRVVLVGSGSGQEDDYVSVISNQKWPTKKRPVIAHIKAGSKHSSLTINRTHLKITQEVVTQVTREVVTH